MKIAYISKKNILDINEWSGSAYGIYKCLKYANFKVELIHNFNFYLLIILKVIEKGYSLLNTKFDPDRSILYSKLCARYIEKKIKGKKFDYIVTYDSTLISYLDTNIPIILWTDLNFNLYQKTYFKKYKKFNYNCVKRGNILEKRALKKAFKIIYTSKYAKKNSEKFYKVEKKKIFNLPFSGNVVSKFNRSSLKKLIKKKLVQKKRQINFLSIGVDWKRKGMDDSIKFISKLNDLKYRSIINIVGSKPKSLKKYNIKNIKFFKYLSKKNKNELTLLKKLYKNAHYFILLSKAEALGLVFLEAASFGLPIITSNTGGIKTVVRNNGIFFNKKKENQNFSKFKKINTKQNNYEKLSLASYDFYNLNSWRNISKELRKIILN
jgi:glycosyltransferase involved in cell wall biosynthesis